MIMLEDGEGGSVVQPEIMIRLNGKDADDEDGMTVTMAVGDNTFGQMRCEQSIL